MITTMADPSLGGLAQKRGNFVIFSSSRFSLIHQQGEGGELSDAEDTEEQRVSWSLEAKSTFPPCCRNAPSPTVLTIYPYHGNEPR
jgi:hypothetical protein